MKSIEEVGKYLRAIEDIQVIVPKTNGKRSAKMASQKEISSSNHPLSGVMLVAGTVPWSLCILQENRGMGGGVGWGW